MGLKASSTVVDVTDPDQIGRAADQVAHESGGADILINNAGIKRVQTPDDLAGTVAFLVSDDVAFLIGQTIWVERRFGAVGMTSIPVGAQRNQSPHRITAVDEAIELLTNAAAGARPIPPLRDLLAEGGLAAAYAVQTAMIARRVTAGTPVVGRKIGLTHPKVQAQLGVDEPDFGVLVSDMKCPVGVPIDHRRLLQPRIEAEMAFVLSRDLDAQGPITVEDISSAVDHVLPALEIVDSRIANWNINILDTVADNASAGLFMLGTARSRLADIDPVGAQMIMIKNGDPVSSGSGSECLGNPLLAVAWLATTARDLGHPLQAGEVVLSGALGPMVGVAAGDTFVANISGLGEVTATFT